VKAGVTTDFLRGFLAAYVIHECYQYALITPGLARRDGPVFAAAAVLLIAVHVYVLLSLIRGRHVKATLIILLLLALVYLLGFLPNSPDSYIGPSGRPLNPRRVTMLIIHALSLVVAYAYYRRAYDVERPNHAMQPTASPGTVSLSDD